MIDHPGLFDLAQPQLDQVDDDDDSWVELRDDDTASCSCRYCHTATTARGIPNRGHGPGSPECARMLARIEEMSGDRSSLGSHVQELR